MLRSLVIAAACLATVAASAEPARADRFGGWRGGATLALDVGYSHADQAPELDGIATGGTAIRALIGRGWLLYGVGFSYRLGSASPLGFAWEVELLPIGTGIIAGRWGRLSIFGGVGGHGVTGAIPAAVQLPVEADLELALGSRLRIALVGRATFIAADDSRQDGADNAPFGDELEASVRLRLGRRYFEHDRGATAGNGYYLAGTYAERLGTRFFGAAIGYSIDATMSP